MPEANKESVADKIARLDRLCEIAGTPKQVSVRAPTTKDHGEFIIDRNEGSVLLDTWDISDHNGDPYDLESNRLDDEKAGKVLDALIASADKAAVQARVDWMQGERERVLLSAARAEVDRMLAGRKVEEAQLCADSIQSLARTLSENLGFVGTSAYVEAAIHTAFHMGHRLGLTGKAVDESDLADEGRFSENDMADRMEADVRRLEHQKLVTEVPGGAAIEELLSLDISYESSLDEDGEEFYVYTVDLSNERVSGGGATAALAMHQLSKNIAIHLRGIASDIESAAEEQKLP